MIVQTDAAYNLEVGDWIKHFDDGEQAGHMHLIYKVDIGEYLVVVRCVCPFEETLHQYSLHKKDQITVGRGIAKNLASERYTIT